MSVHITDRQYKCGECGKLFKRISHVREHLKIHSVERPFPCNICTKSFKSAVSNSLLHVKEKLPNTRILNVDQILYPIFIVMCKRVDKLGLLCHQEGCSNHIVVLFTTTCAISAYHHKSCEFESRLWCSVLDTTLCDKDCR